MKRFFLFAAFAAFTSGALAQKGDDGQDAFLKRNPTAKSVHWKGSGDQFIIKLKSGEKEIYNLADAAQRAAAEAKYGPLPTAPPPPPPVVEMTKFTPPVIAQDEEIAAPPTPPVKVKKVVAPPPPTEPPPPPPAKKKRQKV